MRNLVVLAGCAVLSACGLFGGNDEDDARSEASGTGLSVSITSHLGDDQVFRHGDQVSFLVSLSADAYVLLMYQDARGEVTQILPTAGTGPLRLPAGEFQPLPRAGADFRFTVSDPYGEETVWLVASDTPPPTLPGRRLDNGLIRLEQPAREIRKELKRHADARRSRYAIASVALTTQP